VTADPGYGALSVVAVNQSIGSFSALPARLSSSGGKVELEAVVRGAAECRFSSANRVNGLPAQKGCASGWASVTIALPPNATRSARTYEFELIARSAAGRPTTKHTKVIEQPSRSPRITMEPKSQIGAEGTWVMFTAAASGAPTPRGVWQVSTDGGASWSNVPQADEIHRNNTVELEVGVDAFGVNGTGFVVGDAGSFSGYEYRVVFTNVAGSATTRPATLKASTWETASFAGYTDFAPSGESFTSASADWVVPAINCAGGGAYTWAAQWPGVGENTSVVQDGTIEGCSGTTVLPDAAWYELFGDPAVNGGGQVELPIAQYPVAAGDQIAASVNITNSVWTLTITDSTQGWVFSIEEPDTTPPLDERVAQVVTESSIGDVASYGATNFTAATATLDGQSGPLGSFFPVALAMSAGSTPLDLPGPFDSTGEKFTDTWEAY
jgi:hypothetical protein